MVKISDFKDGDLFKGDLMIVSSQIKKTSTNSKFIQLTLNTVDNNKIEAKKWQTDSIEGYEPGTILEIIGKVQEYRGAKSVIINEDSLSELTVDDFPDLPISGSPFTEKQAREEFKKYFQSINNDNLKEIVQFAIQHAPGYFKSPAAKNIHHAFEGGLAYHSLTMAKTADMFCSIYPYLNRDLLITAALLHDTGKTIELAENEYSVAGHLYGHIIIMNDLLQEAIFNNPKLKEDNSVALLKHIILSHHGKLEWGSPVLGLIPEAIIFHHIDKIDADMMIAHTELNNINKDEFTGRVWSLDNRYLFNPGENQILK